jgi:hypothetical protein
LTRKATWMFAVIVAVAVFAPQAVLAAVGSFSSGNGTPAVTGSNTLSGTNLAPGGKFTCKANGCRAVWAESNGTGNGSYGVYASSKDPVGRGLNGINLATTGTAIGLGGQSNSVTGRALNGLALSATGANYGGFFETKSKSGGAIGAYGWASSTASGGGTNYGVYGRNDGIGLNSSGVYGNATATVGSPQTNGVWGNAPSANGAGLYGSGGNYGFYGAGGYAGGYGFGQTLGLSGESPAIGDGSYGLLSYTDVGVSGHLVGKSGNLAGTCTIASSTASIVCSFATPFPGSPAVLPIVIVTPTQDQTQSGPRFWVDTVTTTGFTLHRNGTSGGAVTYNWMAIGLDASMDTLSAARTERARAAGYGR